MKVLHTMIRVGDLEKSVDFYTRILGMKELRRKDYPEGRFTLCFVGYENQAPESEIELTHNWDTDSYELGTGFGHIAIGVADVHQACDQIRARGGNIIREPGPMKAGKRVLAFVADPDGYKIEILAV